MLYLTKLFAKDMLHSEGKIFVWTYKGDVFLRKENGGVPTKIESQDDLNKMRDGTTSVEKGTPPTEAEPAQENVINED